MRNEFAERTISTKGFSDLHDLSPLIEEFLRNIGQRMDYSQL